MRSSRSTSTSVCVAVTISSPVLAGIFAAALAASVAVLFVWRMRTVRRSLDADRGLGPSLLPSPAGLVFAVLGLAFFLTRFFFGPDADFIQSRASRTATFLVTLSWTGLAMVLSVALV